MRIDLPIFSQLLEKLPHTPHQAKPVSTYVLTHILAPLRANGCVMFADLDFDAFTEEDLDDLCRMLSEEEERQNQTSWLQRSLRAAKPKAAAVRRFC